MRKCFLIIFTLLAVFFVMSAFVGCGTGKNDTYAIDAVANFGSIDVANSASAGRKVRFSVTADAGYMLDKVYVNGKSVEADSFVMPGENVSLYATFCSASGFAVQTESSDLGVTVSDLSVANQGETVRLYTFASYNHTVDYYTVNDIRIDGDTFTMPGEDVVVKTCFKQAIPSTDLSMTVTQSATNATSHWYVDYANDGIQVTVLVEDNLVYSVTSLQSDIAYIDNVEFILGFKDFNGAALGLRNYKVIIAANGAFRFERYNGKGWINYASSVSVNKQDRKLFDDGYAGWSAQMFIPYSAIGVTRGDAYGNVTIAVAMRNTVNGRNSSWGCCVTNGCQWTSPKTHFLVSENGFVMDAKPTTAKNLFVGNGLFDVSNWTGFSTSMQPLGDCVSIAREGVSVADWTKRIDEIASISSRQVFFSGGLEDISETGVLGAFKNLADFVCAWEALCPDVKLTLVSQIPQKNVSVDNDAIAAFNGMVKDYVSSLDNVDYIDLSDGLYQDKTVYASLFGSSKVLSGDGYQFVAKSILKYCGKYSETSGVWGDMNQFVQTSKWAQTADTVSVNNGGIQEAFYTLDSAKDFTFTFDLTAHSVYNSDAWPKFGAVVRNANKNMYFYIDGQNNLTNLSVGMVEKAGDTYLWDDALTSNMPRGCEYDSGKFVTMTVQKTGNRIKYYVNGNLLLDTEVDFGSRDCVVGLFCFNTQIEVKNWSFLNQTAD